jgi:hypothetical protein
MCSAAPLEIAVEPGVAERPHRQLGGLDDAPDRLAVPGHDHGRVQLVVLPRSSSSRARASSSVSTLSISRPAKSRVWSAPITRPGRLVDTLTAFSSARASATSRGEAPSASSPALVASSSTPAMTASKVEPGIAQDRLPGRTLRGQGDRRHPSTSTWPRPPDSRLMIAAAVSSTERRVTSMIGQPIFSNRRRAAMISLRTESVSI